MSLQIDSNEKALEYIWQNGSSDYQRRMPDPTQASISEQLDQIMAYAPTRNEFMDALINQIGTVIARSISWTNPLAIFKQKKLELGDTIQEIQTGLLKAHVYDADRDYMEQTIFGKETPITQANYHKVNRRNFYKVTVNELLLKRAFSTPNGLNQYVTQLLQAPTTSDSWDEFLATANLFLEYEQRGGFWHVHVPDVSGSTPVQADVQEILRIVRSFAETIQFPSQKYNAAHFPTFAKPDEIILFTTPEFRAALDVNALAGAFNIERMDVPNRIITIPRENFRLDGVQAVLTTKDFFVIADQILENRSMPNPAGLGTNYFLHHHEVISASRFVPAIALTTGAGDEAPIVIIPPTAVTTPVATDINDTTVTEVEHGKVYQLSATVTPATSDQAVFFSIAGANSPQTFITRNSVLHVGINETATSLVITAHSAFVNPDTPGTVPPSSSTPLTLTVTGEPVTTWPVASDEVKSVAIVKASDGTAAPTTAKVGDAIQYGVVVTYANGQTSSVQTNDPAIDWSSSDTDIAAVTGGEVTALAVGTTLIKAEVGGIESQITLTVSAA